MDEDRERGQKKMLEMLGIKDQGLCISKALGCTVVISVEKISSTR